MIISQLIQTIQTESNGAVLFLIVLMCAVASAVCLAIYVTDKEDKKRKLEYELSKSVKRSKKSNNVQSN